MEMTTDIASTVPNSTSNDTNHDVEQRCTKKTRINKPNQSERAATCSMSERIQSEPTMSSVLLLVY